ncbi:helix-turn-helix domain-containing protein [Gulosibacter sp. ACHW.36C]|uniref:Helix-turn-helix domain-containing protein n=1 Tax=Gulosibacter sediminis TaxID=1729695 RepID=A0ABY4MUU1_9MICO|nr:helix-turn-helix domain-containing protein [Gulosibacter sediminis]UQN14154.1 helix-turn-helix domain-containing protein [Gulosibacter sediminis]
MPTLHSPVSQLPPTSTVDAVVNELIPPTTPGGAIRQRAVVHSFAQWERVVAKQFIKLHLRTTSDSFEGVLERIWVEDMCATYMSADQHSVHRLSTDTDPDDPQLLKLSLLVEGECVVTQGENSASLGPGDVTVYDTGRPYTLEYAGPMRTFVLIFPMHLLGIPRRLLADATALRLRGDEGIGKVISPFMQHIAENLNMLTDHTGVKVMHSALGLISTLLSTELAAQASIQPEGYRADMDKYRSFIEANLGDPELCTESVAAAHFLSTRYLQHLFSEDGTTVSDFIRTRRLERCRESLLDPAQASLTILQIAQEWGFVDAAHFSRTFKSAFGTSPSVYRRAHQSAATRP